MALHLYEINDEIGYRITTATVLVIDINKFMVLAHALKVLIRS